MNIEIINIFIKFIAINLGIAFSFFKIINYPKRIKLLIKIAFIFLSIILTFLQCIFLNIIPAFYRILMVFICYSIVLGKYAKVKIIYSMFITIIGVSLSYIANFISSMITAVIFHDTYYRDINDPLPFIFAATLCLVFLYLFFKIKRFKNGFPFIQRYKENEFFCLSFLIISMIIISIYFFFSDFSHFQLNFLLAGFVLFVAITAIIIQKTFVMYQKQKLQLQALKDYEQELSETKQKLETAIQEKEMIVKSNHEFYHRQEALSKKLDLLIHTQADSMNTEFGKDYSDIVDRLTTLSNEYNEKTASAPNIAKSNITEIDDMLTYMQSECLNNNIEFILKIDCDINHIITNFITKSQLETLLGDLIRNAIISINHSSNTYRSIMVVFGIKDDAYELCILDSGIPFEVETLINLGINKASTHLDEGGSGIGFITTFETINSCGASFIVNEITNNNYTKSLEIKFDDRHEYIIISDRKDQLKEMNKIDRDIILK